MAAMAEPLTIPTGASPPPGVSFAQLRAEGIAQLQQLSGKLWTDHNAHDPGITILEVLCYVLSDLAYRANYDIRDLLASSPGGSSAAASLFSPAEILTTDPVTVLDLRKLVLDVQGVKNVWIEPAQTLEPPLRYDPADDAISLAAGAALDLIPLRGVYRVIVAPDRSGVDPAAIRQRLDASRPLGLDFLAPEILQEQTVGVIAEIEIDHARLPADVLREVYRVAADYVSPQIRFHTLAEMLARGRSLDEIFDGPRLQHGFIDNDELEGSQRAAELHTSDLLALFMEIEGVCAVHQLRLKKDGAAEEPWVLELEPSQTPVLDLQATAITLVRGGVRWHPPAAEVARVTEAAAEKPVATDLPALPGRDRQVQRYHSLQHHFPQVFGLGAAGLPADATLVRRAQARQLRAYLMLFDQVLANCFSQLAHAGDLFSPASERGGSQSYFGQLPTDVPFADEILEAGFSNDELQALLETPESAAARQQRFLDHLLARFAEDFSGYTLQSHALGRGLAERLEPQRAFLREYPEVSGGLGRAFDYTRPSWGEANRANVSGLEKRIACKLGLARYCRRTLAGLPPDDEGGFHLVEHLLLRPGPADAGGGDTARPAPPFLAQPSSHDPYSAQLSFIFPDWIVAFGSGQPGDDGNPGRDYVRKTVREETPAHLSVRVHWFSRDDLAAFEPAYRAWLESMVIPS